MKKIIPLLVSALMLLSLAACGSKTTTPETTTAPAASGGKTLIVYFLLITFGFVYLYPLLYMIINSLMTVLNMAESGKQMVQGLIIIVLLVIVYGRKDRE